MAEMVLPGVYIEVRPEALIVPGPVTISNLGVVGTASKGPIGKATLLGSIAEAYEKFGTPDAWQGSKDELTLVRALEIAYAHGASTVFAVRVAQANAAQSATFNVRDANDALCAKLIASTPGTWGNDLRVTVFPAEQDIYIVNERHLAPGPFTLKYGPVKADDSRTRVTIQRGATRETANFTVVTGAPAAGEVRIDNKSLTFAGNEGPGQGDTLFVSYVILAADSRKVTISDGTTSETYTVASGRHLVEQVNALPAELRLVSGDATTATDEKPKVDASANKTRFFGAGGETAGTNGEAVTDNDYEAGLHTLLNEAAHIIVAAGVPNETITGNAIGAKLKAHCETASTDKMRRDRVAVVGSKLGDGVKAVQGYGLESDRVIVVTPGIKATDAASRKTVTLPGAYTAAAIAGMLSARSPHVSLTNKSLAVSELETRFTTAELEQLVLARVLAVEERHGRGIRVVKAVTTSTNTAWTQITTRRIVDYAKYGVRSAADPYIGLLNNDRVRKALKGSINGFLAEMVDDEMLTGYELEVSATRDEEIRGIARVIMTLQPTFSIDYIKVTMFLG